MIQSVDRALAILELLHFSRRGLGVSQIAEELDLHVSTVHHLLRTLADRGYVRQDPETRRYALAHKIMRLASRFSEELSLVSVAFPQLRQLCATTGEAVQLAVLGRSEVLLLIGLDTSEPVPPRRWLEHGLPAHCTAHGKVLLAGLTAERFRAFVEQAGLRPYTQRTITCPQALSLELDRVRAQGYALDSQEYQDWLLCVAAPVADVTGATGAALSIACPIYRCTDEKLRWLTDQVVASAHRLSGALAAVSPPLWAGGWA
jgi:IclR family transcriptional regulator, KDG regulon repressor